MTQSLRELALSALLTMALLAPGPPAALAASSFGSDVERALKRANQDLCRSFETLKCKRNAPASPSTTHKAKEEKEKPAAKQPAEPGTAIAAPIPRQKPVRVEGRNKPWRLCRV